MPDEQRPQRRGGVRPSAVVSAVGRIADECSHGSAVRSRCSTSAAAPAASPSRSPRPGTTSPSSTPAPTRSRRSAAGPARPASSTASPPSRATATRSSAVLAGRRVDLACCHGTLEFVDDPAATLHAIAQALGEGGVLSLLVSGRLSVVFAKAIAGEFGQARAALVDPSGRWGSTDPLPRRFDVEQLETLLADAGFTDVRVRGTNILGHLVPASLIDSEADRVALAELDDLLVSGPGREFLRTLGNALHVVARRD